MFIVISGAGKVGSYLCRILAGKGHSVVLIEKHHETLKKSAGDLSADILLIEGDSSQMQCLEDAGMDHADIFVAATGSDQDNLVSCQLARVRFNVKRILSRVNNPKNEYTFHALGIEAVSATSIIAYLIEKEMTVGEVFTVQILKKGRLLLVEINLARGHCAVANMKISELVLPGKTVFISLIRGDEIIVPRGDTVIQTGDRIIAVTSIEHEPVLRRILTGN